MEAHNLPDICGSICTSDYLELIGDILNQAPTAQWSSWEFVGAASRQRNEIRLQADLRPACATLIDVLPLLRMALAIKSPNNSPLTMNNHSADFLQPTLTGKHITLRPLAPADFAPLFEIASDPLLWAQHPEPTRYQREVFERFFHSGIESKGALVAVDQASQQLVACSRYYDWRPAERTVCIGYTFVSREYWGTGMNRELKSLMLEHASGWVSTVLFEVGAENHRSRRALEKIGAVFSHEAVVTERPGVVYAIKAAALPQGLTP